MEKKARISVALIVIFAVAIVAFRHHAPNQPSGAGAINNTLGAD